MFPGKISDSSPEDVYDRDFHYNRTLGSNIDESPSQAFKSGGRHVDINGYVGIIDNGLVWATTHRGDPIGYGPDVDATDTTLGFLDQVATEGLDAIEEKYIDEAERERTALEQFLAADVVDGTVRRDVTGGESLLPDSPAYGVDSSVGELVSRTVDAVIETDESDYEDKPPVFILADRGTGDTYVHPAKAADEPTIRLLLSNRQQELVTVYTDGFRAYEPLDEDDVFNREYVVHGEGEYADRSSGRDC